MNSKDTITKVHEYYYPILKILDRLGGCAHIEMVYERVERELKDILGRKDYDCLETGIREVRWRNHTRQARRNLVGLGLLYSKSRGIWALHDMGRVFLANHAEELEDLAGRKGLLWRNYERFERVREHCNAEEAEIWNELENTNVHVVSVTPVIIDHQIEIIAEKAKYLGDEEKAIFVANN